MRPTPPIALTRTEHQNPSHNSSAYRLFSLWRPTLSWRPACTDQPCHGWVGQGQGRPLRDGRHDRIDGQTHSASAWDEGVRQPNPDLSSPIGRAQRQTRLNGCSHQTTATACVRRRAHRVVSVQSHELTAEDNPSSRHLRPSPTPSPSGAGNWEQLSPVLPRRGKISSVEMTMTKKDEIAPARAGHKVRRATVESNRRLLWRLGLA